MHVAEIPLIATRPEAQGLGLARLLLRHLEAALIRCSCSPLDIAMSALASGINLSVSSENQH